MGRGAALAGCTVVVAGCLGLGTVLALPVATPPPAAPASAVASSAPEPPHALYGTADVIDGDTIDLHDTRIRLYGIDAPEKGQLCRDAAGAAYPCGGRAANALDALIARRPVGCDARDHDRYGRTVAVCYVGDVDLNAAMVRAGQALAYRDYGTDYVPQEDAARRERVGLWAGTFEAPWDYRHRPRPAAAPPKPRAPGCCRTCAHSQPCGDACIPADATCHAAPGCACAG